MVGSRGGVKKVGGWESRVVGVQGWGLRLEVVGVMGMVRSRGGGSKGGGARGDGERG